jgi:BirA family transcriptional regulator, biotin operon repressor / biotin---[acetyl-CoA-carboxylase] ligase
LITVFHLDETGSTNADAMARAIAGEQLPFWVTAQRQTAGRGRSGREWVSAPGNLYASLAIGLACDQQTASQLSLVAGVAVMDALLAVSATQPDAQMRDIFLKWPNDIMTGRSEGAKLGGILIQTAREPSGGRLLAIVGCGLNISNAPGINRNVTHLSSLRFQITSLALYQALAKSMAEALSAWNEGTGFAQIRQRWQALATPIGTPLRINIGATLTDGSFAGLDDDGALVLTDTSGRNQRFTFGDVQLQSAP